MSKPLAVISDMTETAPQWAELCEEVRPVHHRPFPAWEEKSFNLVPELKAPFFRALALVVLADPGSAVNAKCVWWQATNGPKSHWLDEIVAGIVPARVRQRAVARWILRARAVHAGGVVARLVALLLVLALPGCGYVRPSSFAVDPDLPVEVQEAVVAASTQWSDAIPLRAAPVTVEKRDWGVIRSGTDGKCIDPRVAGWADIGTDRQPSVVLCLENVAAMRETEEARIELIHVTALHELGHALGGRGDHLEPGHVMAAHEATREITPLDVSYVLGGV